MAARAAAFPIFEIIDRRSKIDGLSETGVAMHYASLNNAGSDLNNLQGLIEISDVRFAYPGKPDQPVDVACIHVLMS